MLCTAQVVGDAFVDGIGLAVDAVDVDLEQDGDTVPGAAGTLAFSQSDRARRRS